MVLSAPGISRQPVRLWADGATSTTSGSRNAGRGLLAFDEHILAVCNRSNKTCLVNSP